LHLGLDALQIVLDLLDPFLCSLRNIVLDSIQVVVFEDAFPLFDQLLVPLYGLKDQPVLGQRVVHEDALDRVPRYFVKLAFADGLCGAVPFLVAKEVYFPKVGALSEDGKRKIILGI
jgi:hypothetical protein